MSKALSLRKIASNLAVIECGAEVYNKVYQDAILSGLSRDDAEVKAKNAAHEARRVKANELLVE